MKQEEILCWKIVWRLLLLSWATWEAKPHIGFKAKGYVAPEKRGPFYNDRSLTSASDGRWQHESSPPPQFWHVFDRGGKLASRDNTHGKLLTNDHGAFGTTDFTSTYVVHSIGLWWHLESNSGPRIVLTCDREF